MFADKQEKTLGRHFTEFETNCETKKTPLDINCIGISFSAIPGSVWLFPSF